MSLLQEGVEDKIRLHIIHDGTEKSLEQIRRMEEAVGEEIDTSHQVDWTQYEWSTDGNPNNPFPGPMPQFYGLRGRYHKGSEGVESFIDEFQTKKSKK